MDNPQKKAFFDVFNCLRGKLGQELEEVLAASFASSLKIDRAAKILRTIVHYGGFVDTDNNGRLERALETEYKLSAAEVTPVFEGVTPDAAMICACMRYAARSCPAADKFIDDARMRLDGDSGAAPAVITAGAHAAQMLIDAGFARALEDFLRAAFGRDITVVIETADILDNGDGDAEFERRRQQVIKAAQQAAEAERQEGSRVTGRERPASGMAAKGKRKKADKMAADKDVIFGRATMFTVTEMKEINADSGFVAVLGHAFDVQSLDLKSGKTKLTVDVTDYTGSIRAKLIRDKEHVEELLGVIKEGAAYYLYGEMQYDKYENDCVMNLKDLISVKLPERADSAPDGGKRVELHMHTAMSAMDAVTGAKRLIERAAKWGHRAVAITDHGVLQAFPEAQAAAAKLNIKVIYGVEGYYRHTLEDAEVLRGGKGKGGMPLDGTFVCFDIETTGVKAAQDGITEIAAVRIENGVVIGEFHTMSHPGVPIPPNITEITGITDAMVTDAPPQDDAVAAFLEFAGDDVLVAHNAGFDVGFIKTACRRMGIEREFCYIDTLDFSRVMLPTLPRHTLASVAEGFGLTGFNHHRAMDDTKALAGIFTRLMDMLRQRGAGKLADINPALSAIMRAAQETGTDSGNLPVRHIIILVKNQIGLKNLYRLVSESHLNYMNGRKQPVIPRFLLSKHREGLMIGSACEAGEIYSMLLDGAEWKDIVKRAKYYDFLEIQPVGNNMFLVDSGKLPDAGAIRALNKKVVELADQVNIPVVATGDVHFLDPRDEVFRRILMAGKGFADADKQAPLYFKTTDEMLEEFSYLGEKTARRAVVTNPNKIADMCEAVSPIRDGTFPPVIEGSAAALEAMVMAKAADIYGDPLPPAILDRTREELDIIVKHGFDAIYYAAQQIVAKSLSEGYLVGSRGSVGSSIVAYFAGITEVNALPPHYICGGCKHSDFDVPEQYAVGVDMPDKDCPKCGKRLRKDGYNLTFAIFLGFSGDKAADIDLNISGEYQARAHKHAIEIFGETQVFRAGTIGTLAEKTAFGFVRKYNEERGIVVSNAEENRLIKGCVGVRRATGQHPGGMVIVPGGMDAYDFFPVQRPADDVDSDVVTTHFDYHSMNENLLKLDLLGHDDPTIIKYLEDATGVNALEIPLDDPDTMTIFTSPKILGLPPDEIIGATGAAGIPEFGTRFVRQMLVDTKPTTMEGLLRISGLSHGTNVWTGNAQELVRSGRATLDEIICVRDDILHYLVKQGMPRFLSFQIMEKVRKKGPSLTPEWEEEMGKYDLFDWYIDSCRPITNLFPKSHAIAYVMMALRIAWFKVHRPIAFYSAFFSIRARGVDATIMGAGLDAVKKRIAELTGPRDKKNTAAEDDLLVTLEVVYEFLMRGFNLLPVDISESDIHNFLIRGDALRLPLTAMPGLGEAAAADIIRERAGTPFLSGEDILNRCPKLSRPVLEKLAAHGALGNLPPSTQMALF